MWVKPSDGLEMMGLMLYLLKLKKTRPGGGRFNAEEKFEYIGVFWVGLDADAVVGWSWIYFRDYDFAKNPLGFSERVMPLLRQNGQAMKEIEVADCIGIDFHKVGFAPYVSSCFLYKDAAEFESLHRRGTDAYLQVRTPYNPMYYTLEVLRDLRPELLPDGRR